MMDNTKASNSDGEQVTGLVLDIFRLHGALIRFGDQFVHQYGLTSASWQVLGGIASKEAPTVPQIAKEMGQARQSVQRQVKGLVERGLVRIDDNPNHRRSHLVRLTPEGEELFAKISVRWMTWADSVASSLKASDLERSAGVLNLLSQALEVER